MSSPMPFSMRIKSYRLLNVISKTPNSMVYLAIDPHSSSEKLAIKFINTQLVPSQCYETERQLLQEINHKYVLKIRKSFIINGNLALVMTKCNGDLHSAVKRAIFPNLLSRIRLMFRILVAIRFLHSFRILHGDIKPANVLLLNSQFDDPRPAIIDFGFACILPENEYCKCNRCTLSYASPEIAALKPHSFPSDVWSTGATFFYILSGKDVLPHAFTPADSPYIYVKKIKMQGGLFDEAPAGLKKLISSMMSYDPNDRPTAQQCLDSEFFLTVLGREWIDKEIAETSGGCFTPNEVRQEKT